VLREKGATKTVKKKGAYYSPLSSRYLLQLSKEFEECCDTAGNQD
jgi:hypothetical protein